MNKPALITDVSAILLILGLMLGSVIGFTSGLIWAGKIEINTSQLFPQIDYASPTEELAYYQDQLTKAQEIITSLTTRLAQYQTQSSPTSAPAPPPSSAPPPRQPASSFTGEQLWQAVNKYRREHGVPELQFLGSLCQLSSRRLGEIIDLGKLDNHAGFEKYFESHDINELGVNNIAENLASGYSSAWDTVMGWDSSPPHRTFLLADGSYKWGCASANLGYAVLIGGY